MSEYKIVYKGGTGEIVEKKSRFIANVFKVESEDEALEIIEQTRKKYWDARHNCFAYIIGENGQTKRCSDDKEPQGTAGKPILRCGKRGNSKQQYNYQRSRKEICDRH